MTGQNKRNELLRARSMERPNSTRVDEVRKGLSNLAMDTKARPVVGRGKGSLLWESGFDSGLGRRGEKRVIII